MPCRCATVNISQLQKRRVQGFHEKTYRKSLHEHASTHGYAWAPAPLLGFGQLQAFLPNRSTRRYLRGPLETPAACTEHIHPRVTKAERPARAELGVWGNATSPVSKTKHRKTFGAMLPCWGPFSTSTTTAATTTKTAGLRA